LANSRRQPTPSSFADGAMAALGVSAADQSFSVGFGTSPDLATRHGASLSPQRTVKGTRLPREGPNHGGGMMAVVDRGVFDGRIREALSTELEDEEQSAEMTRRNRGPSARTTMGLGSATGDLADHTHARLSKPPASKSAMASASRTTSSGFGASGENSGGDRQRPEERRYQEMLHKKEKADAIRSRDQKAIMERIELAKDLREARFKRLLTSMTGEGTLAYETAVDLRERTERENARRRELYQEWDEKIFQPMASQADRYLNPPDRRLEQALSGTKSVAWNLPGEGFKLIHKARECPARRPVVERARENAFHHAAEKVLGRSQSAPSLRGTSGLAGADEVSLKARSKETLDPTVWGQTQLQGTLYGHFAQKSEHGPGFRACTRLGPGVHLPDESDGIPAAGTRFSRTSGYGDKGILVGSRASRGESSEWKTPHGRSSAAPAQDHFAFETGRQAADLEFPLGKRMPPPGIPR